MKNSNNTVVFRLTHFLIIFFVSSVVNAQLLTDLPQNNQKDEKPSLKERLFFGGHFGLQFGTFADIQISPVIGLWVLPRVNVALGPTYRFYKYRFDKTHIFGGKAFTELILLRNINSVIPIGTNTSIIAHFEDELLSLQSSFFKDTPPYSSDRFFVNTVLAGGGISQQIGKKSYLNFVFLWALNDSQYGIYTNPEIRVLFLF